MGSLLKFDKMKYFIKMFQFPTHCPSRNDPRWLLKIISKLMHPSFEVKAPFKVFSFVEKLGDN